MTYHLGAQDVQPQNDLEAKTILENNNACSSYQVHQQSGEVETNFFPIVHRSIRYFIIFRPWLLFLRANKLKPVYFTCTETSKPSGKSEVIYKYWSRTFKDCHKGPGLCWTLYYWDDWRGKTDGHCDGPVSNSFSELLHLLKQSAEGCGRLAWPAVQCSQQHH